MQLKEELKQEIDELPEDALYRLKAYLKITKILPPKRASIPKLHLQGEYDAKNLREVVYE